MLSTCTTASNAVIGQIIASRARAARADIQSIRTLPDEALNHITETQGFVYVAINATLLTLRSSHVYNKSDRSTH